MSTIFSWKCSLAQMMLPVTAQSQCGREECRRNFPFAVISKQTPKNSIY